MVESNNFKVKLYRSNAFQHVLQFYDMKQLLEFRTVSQKMADEIVPRSFNYLRYECPEEDDDQEYTFQRLIRHAKKVEIKNICGTEAHLKKIEEIGRNLLGQAEYLYLEFDDDDTTQDSQDLAKQYVEVFRTYFPAIKTLRIETIGDRNFTKMLDIMMEDHNFPWFESVITIKCYQVRYLQDMNKIKHFFTRFRNLLTFKGITEEEFNPLDVFIKEGKKVPNISWTLPEKEQQRKEVLAFLEFNQTQELKLYGGALEKVKVDTLYLENTRSLTLIDMPSFDLEAVFHSLPELKAFHVQNVDDFKKEAFQAVAAKFSTYKGLEKLGLELTAFDLEETKEDLFQILRTHNATLKQLLIGRNKISNSFLNDLCNAIKELNVIEVIDLTHLKEANKIDWKQYLESIALLSQNRPGNPIRVILSDYQTRLKQKIFFDYLGQNKPNIEINYL